ncbi:MAG: 4-amino-4-deoxy-L-arabinose transferase or related glycosyltransferase of family [Verrucomicrobiota bacterium]|jgi:4-amino-4-deoxy-L-arabinose transferase-like glycosyltransferase
MKDSSAFGAPAEKAIPKPLSRSRLWLLFLGITVFLCLGNGSLPLIDRDEPRFAEASREMMQSGNWVVPTFNNAPRYDKPPLIYWMQVACYRALGDNAFAARLPAALCTALNAILLVVWGTRLAQPAVGLRAAFMFLLCLQVFVHGRAAVADPPMVLFVTAAAWLGWEWMAHPQSSRIAAGFWLSLALGFLAKGPIAWVPIGMVGWAAWNRRRAGQPVPSLTAWTLGTLGMLLLVCLWGIPALTRTGGAFAAKGLGEHVVGRSLIAMEGHGAASILGYLATLPFYFLTLFPSFAPWSFWLPALWKDRQRVHSPAFGYLASGVFLVFGIFTLSRTKLPHYTLPCFPLLALTMALWWSKAKPSFLFRKTAAITAIVFTLVPLLLFPAVRNLSLTEAAILRVRPLLTPETKVALVDFQEPSLIWGLRSSIKGYPEMVSEGQVTEWLAQGGPRLCLLTAQAAEKTPGPWSRDAIRGWNFAKGRRTTLVLLRPVSPETSAP